METPKDAEGYFDDTIFATVQIDQSALDTCVYVGELSISFRDFAKWVVNVEYNHVIKTPGYKLQFYLYELAVYPSTRAKAQAFHAKITELLGQFATDCAKPLANRPRLLQDYLFRVRMTDWYKDQQIPLLMTSILRELSKTLPRPVVFDQEWTIHLATPFRFAVLAGICAIAFRATGLMALKK